MATFAIYSAGSRLNGLAYLAAGEDMRPVVVFLHGFPGNEKNLDLLQAARRAGYQAVYFDYRGSWGSGGTFSFSGALDDVSTVLAWVREPHNAARYHFDTRHVALVGHSVGGWLALLTSAQDREVACVAAIAADNLGWAGSRMPTDTLVRSSWSTDFSDATDSGRGPIRADPTALASELVSRAAGWDYMAAAPALAGRPLLLIAATHDSPEEDIHMHRRLAEAVKAAGGRRVATAEYDDDHPFSANRLALTDTLVTWLKRDCGLDTALPPSH